MAEVHCCQRCARRLRAVTEIRWTYNGTTYALWLCGPHLRQWDTFMREWRMGATEIDTPDTSDTPAPEVHANAAAWSLTYLAAHSARILGLPETEVLRIVGTDDALTLPGTDEEVIYLHGNWRITAQPALSVVTEIRRI